MLLLVRYEVQISCGTIVAMLQHKYFHALVPRFKRSGTRPALGEPQVIGPLQRRALSSLQNLFNVQAKLHIAEVSVLDTGFGLQSGHHTTLEASGHYSEE